jgi:hypothetical protein
MSGRIRILAAVAVLSIAPAFAGCAYAQYGSSGRYGGYSRVAPYDIGYQEGREHGIRDGRQGRRFEYRDTNEYRRADRGWNGRYYGNRNAYRAEFRRGYERGYRDGYYSAGYGGRAGDRYPGGAYPNRYPGGAYPGGTYPGGRYGYRSPAAEHGFREGYEKGLEDLRDRDRYDPRRHGWYRKGDRHYDRRYGSKDQWKNEYRRAFLEGYDRAYRGR